jgi:hypothetical protein
MIARDMYDMSEYFQIMNDDNPSFQKRWKFFLEKILICWLLSNFEKCFLIDK